MDTSLPKASTVNEVSYKRKFVKIYERGSLKVDIGKIKAKEIWDDVFIQINDLSIAVGEAYAEINSKLKKLEKDNLNMPKLDLKILL